MGKEAIRKELQRITKDEDVRAHGARIAELSSRNDCSVRALPDYDPASRENFNCFEYALCLNEQLRNSTLANLGDFDVLVDYRFIDYLNRSGFLHPKSSAEMQDGDLVIYFREGKAQHAGRWNDGRVRSKWGRG
jgi:hypothetical protein